MKLTVLKSTLTANFFSFTQLLKGIVWVCSTWCSFWYMLWLIHMWLRIIITFNLVNIVYGDVISWDRWFCIIVLIRWHIKGILEKLRSALRYCSSFWESFVMLFTLFFNFSVNSINFTSSYPTAPLSPSFNPLEASTVTLGIDTPLKRQ